MKRFWKFIALAVAGFLLGAGAAWLQQPHPSTGSMSTAPTLQQKIAAMPKPAEKTDKPAPAEDPAKTEAASGDDGVAAPSAETKADTSPLTAAPADKGDDGLTAPAPDDKAAEAPKQDAVAPEVATKMAEAKGDATTQGVGGAFSLIDQNGHPVTEKSWPGKYLLVFFGFTNCPDVCPVTLDKLTAVLHQLGDDDADKVQTLFITVDPARDKPNVLKDYVGHFHKSILGLTGSEDQVKAAEQAYKVFTARHDSPNGHDYSFDHSTFVYFMAPDGTLAEIIHTEDKPSDIADRIRPYLEGKKQAGSQAQ